MAILNPYFRSEKENFIFLNKSVFSQAPLGREGGQFKEVLGRSKKISTLVWFLLNLLHFFALQLYATEAKGHGELDQHDVSSP
jgi:hypothetical protein